MKKFYSLLGKLFIEIRDDLHAVYQDSSLSKGAISNWMNHFNHGRETTEDDKHTGRQKLVLSNGHYFLRYTRYNLKSLCSSQKYGYWKLLCNCN